jgi:polyisoprenyl-teichoic acid--peptidoglycan teichoic acid transferase
LLIAGKNGMNVDTMILAQVDISKKRVTMVSIPRDLFYKGRKINSVYALYGMKGLGQQLKEITGVHIDKYLLIDMYAFIEVIDAMGGIDVTLENPIVDPTYKIFEYGTWQTLHYPKGTHHLSGTEALRIARSRHFSSDFARAENQHMILQAIKNKTGKLGAGDAVKIIKMINVVLTKTETDVSTKEALSYYLRFKEYTIRSGYVLSTGNILQSELTGTNEEEHAETKCKKTLPGTDKIIEVLCSEIQRAYILLPRKDWHAVKNYVQWIFNKD